VYIYVECAADHEICIYYLGVNNHISFLFFFYIFVTIHFTKLIKEDLEFFLHDKI